MGKWDYAAWTFREAPEEGVQEERRPSRPVPSALPQFWDDAEAVDPGEPEPVESLEPEPEAPPMEAHITEIADTDVGQDVTSASPEVKQGEETERPQIIGTAEVIQGALELVERVANTRATVLLEGGGGTGKALFAREIHRRSKRKKRPYVVVNCAAESRLESRLFGQMKGAFAGASRSVGLFERAETGTLVLKEIGDAPPGVQAQLLRAIQDKTIEPLGGDRARAVDVRLVVTSSRDLSEEVRGGRFRSDLFYLLRGARIRLPSLGERREDIVDLAHHFVTHYRDAHGRSASKISHGALTVLKDHHWPGNVRELRSVMNHAVLMCEGGPILVDHLPKDLETGASACGGDGSTPIRTSRRDLVEMVTGPELPEADELLGELLRVAHLETSTVTGAASSVGYSYPRFRDRLVSLVILPALEEAGVTVHDDTGVREVALRLGIHPRVLVDWVNAEDRQKKKRSVDRHRSMEKTQARKPARKKA